MPDDFAKDIAREIVQGLRGKSPFDYDDNDFGDERVKAANEAVEELCDELDERDEELEKPENLAGMFLPDRQKKMTAKEIREAHKESLDFTDPDDDDND